MTITSPRCNEKCSREVDYPVSVLGTGYLPAAKQMSVETLVIGVIPPLLHVDEEGEDKVMNLLFRVAEVLQVRTGVHEPDDCQLLHSSWSMTPSERTIVVPAPRASRFAGGKKLAGRKTHQLTLRVSEDYRAYMQALREQVDAESLAQLVRWAVVMLEQALDDGFVIERSDGVMVGDCVVSNRNDVGKRVRRGDDGGIIRINVGLDGDQHARFKRLSKRTGLGLVEMVATALGVLDAWLVDAGDTPVGSPAVSDDGDPPPNTPEKMEESALK